MDKMICVGKNYLEHARELGDAVPERPVLFIKPPSVAALARGAGETLEVELPRGHGSVHHECEIAVRLGAGGYRLSVADAERAIGAVTLALDMTLRELQAQLKKNGHPWEVSKVFPGSAILGPWIPVAEFPGFREEAFELRVNGQLRQRGRGAEMRTGIAECIAYASEHFPLVAGDVVFTGTPAGVGPVQPGDAAELRWGSRLAYGVRWR